MRRNRSTLRDVAKLAGVSTATVSRVLNGNHQISDTLRIAVMRAVSALHYVPNPHAMELARANGGKKRKRHTISRHGGKALPARPIEPVTIQKMDLSSLTSRMLNLEKENASLRRTLSKLISELDQRAGESNRSGRTARKNGMYGR